MPTFTYTARNQQGLEQTGRLEALDEDQVAAALQHRGLLVTSISRKDVEPPVRRPAARRPRSRKLHRGVTTQDQVLLCQQLATMVDAGVPLLKCLKVVMDQVESRELVAALEEVYRDVESGSTLRDGLAKHPRIFSNLWINLVETGEASGHLAQALSQLSRHFESAQHLQNEAKTAVTYPAFLIVAAVLVVAVFVYWLIPKFTGMFTAMQVELPLLTRIVIGVSHFARQYVVAIVFGVGAVGYALSRYLQTEHGRWTRDRLVLTLPVFSRLFTYIQLAEFAGGLSTLLRSGVPLLSGLEILGRSATNKVYGQAIGQLKDAVMEGTSMAAPMEESGMFPPMTVQMVQVGEEVGELAKMTARIAAHYEDRVETFIARMTRMFEPIAIVIMAGLVLIVVLSIFLPIFQMAGGPGIR